MIAVTGGQGRAAVVVRAIGVATITVALAAAGHVAGGADPPDGRLLVATGALLLVAARPLARSPLRARTLLPWALGAQLAVHLAVSWLLGPDAMSMVTIGDHGTVMAASAGHHVMTPSLPMLLAHLAATLVAIGLLVGVDRGAGVLGSWWRTLTVLWGDPVSGPATRRTVTRPERSGHAQGRRAGTNLPGRGPPLALPA